VFGAGGDRIGRIESNRLGSHGPSRRRALR
jgi:hypothetical protein